MTRKNNLPAKAIETLYGKIKQIIEEARNTVYRAANFAMVQAYWNIGKLIVEEEQSGKQRAEYGKQLLKQLSQQLTTEYGRGYDESNLRYIRKFYRTFSKHDTLRHELRVQELEITICDLKLGRPEILALRFYRTRGFAAC